MSECAASSATRDRARPGPILLEGLRRLEYRGYDSAGIALIDEAGDLFVEKRAGKLANLTAALGDGTPHAGIGLAHTRWATHGRPNDLNAHPHVDCSGEITVIHNGIIENFRELRDMLAAEGHELRSETDTEAIAHLVEDAYAGDLADAVRAALSRVDGAYALVVMHRGEPDRLVGARQNVPLIVGLGDGETFIASDVAAVLEHTRRIVFLEEGDIADVRPWGVTITGIDGRPRERVVTEITWTPEAAEKGGYAHFMLKEINEQPQALLSAITGRVTREGRIHLDELATITDALRDGGSGGARGLRQRLLRRPRGGRPHPGVDGAAGPRDGRLGVPLQRRRRSTRGRSSSPSPSPARRPTPSPRPAWPGSAAARSWPSRTPSARRSPARPTSCCSSRPGPEVAVAASKTFVTQVALLVMLAAAIGRLRDHLALDDELAVGKALRRLPEDAQRALDLASGSAELARRYVNSRGLHVRRPRGQRIPRRSRAR